jgi:hypothetical protein
MRESTVAQEWIDIGKDMGKDEGRDEGRLLALRHTLRTLLTKRFGPVSADVLDRIEATTDPETLDRAVEQILDIPRPEDLPL